jgi:hypothetical protein
MLMQCAKEKSQFVEYVSDCQIHRQRRPIFPRVLYFGRHSCSKAKLESNKTARDHDHNTLLPKEVEIMNLICDNESEVLSNFHFCGITVDD